MPTSWTGWISEKTTAKRRSDRACPPTCVPRSGTLFDSALPPFTTCQNLCFLLYNNALLRLTIAGADPEVVGLCLPFRIFSRSACVWVLLSLVGC